MRGQFRMMNLEVLQDEPLIESVHRFVVDPRPQLRLTRFLRWEKSFDDELADTKQHSVVRVGTMNIQIAPANPRRSDLFHRGEMGQQVGKGLPATRLDFTSADE